MTWGEAGKRITRFLRSADSVKASKIPNCNFDGIHSLGELRKLDSVLQICKSGLKICDCKVFPSMDLTNEQSSENPPNAMNFIQSFFFNFLDL